MANKVQTFFLSDKYATFMYFCCLAYCAAAMPMLGIASDLKSVILIGSLPVLYWKFRRNEVDKTIVYLLLTSIVIQVLSWVNSMFVIPDEAKSYPDVKLLISLFLFALMAMWINGSRRRQRTLYSVLIVSFVVTALFDLFVNGSLNLVMSGERIDYGMHNAQYTTMNSAIVIMLVVYLVATKAQEKRSPLDYLLAALIIGFAVFSLAVSQSRQVWLGLLVLGATFPILYAAVYKLSIKSVAILYILIAGIAIAFLSNENVRQRAMTESDVIERIATLDWDNVPMTSVGIRFNSWIEATKWIERSPVLGTSKESIKHVIKQSDKFQASEHTKYLGHLHNYYIETLVAFGIVGLVFIAVFYGHIYSNVSRKGRKVDFLFLLSFLVFWLFINNFESFNSKYYGLYIQNIVLAGLFVMNVVDPQRVGDKTDVS